MISGLVVTLPSDEELAQAVMQSIQQQPVLEMGPRNVHRLPLVLETNCPTESQKITDWLFSLPGVEYVDVAFVHLDKIQNDERVAASTQIAIHRN